MNKLTNLGRFVVVAGLGALSLTACGGSDGGGSAEGFCDSLVRLDESGVDPNTAFDEFEDDFEKMTTAIESIEAYATENCEGLPDDIFN